jgi:membrane protein DedA with SNARE-associated domain
MAYSRVSSQYGTPIAPRMAAPPHMMMYGAASDSSSSVMDWIKDKWMYISLAIIILIIILIVAIKWWMKKSSQAANAARYDYEFL